jgi:hypothetical protein
VLTTYLGALSIVAVFVTGLLLGLVTPAPAWAQQSDPYWQQMIANRAAQCDTQIVQLLRTLDEQKKQIAEMQKQLDELKDKK